MKYIEVEKVQRMGRREHNNRDRPVVVQLKEDYQPWAVLKNAKKLNCHPRKEIRKIRIVKDMTNMQREHEEKMFKDLNYLKEHGEKDYVYYIKRGKIIKEKRDSGRIVKSDSERND